MDTELENLKLKVHTKVKEEKQYMKYIMFEADIKEVNIRKCHLLQRVRETILIITAICYKTNKK